MTADTFRKLALGLPETSEGAHMDHPDFRVGGKIFATLWPDAGWGMVKLTVEQQLAFCTIEPAVFQPVQGGWGRRGATKVILQRARPRLVRDALLAAWKNTAPKRLLRQLEDHPA